MPLPNATSTHQADQRVRAFHAPPLAPVNAEERRLEMAELIGKKRNAGFSEGYALGMQLAADEVAEVMADHERSRDRFERATLALQNASEQLGRRDAIALGEIECDVVAMALALAEEVIGHELRSTAAPVLDAIARGVRLLPDRSVPIVRVHPEDLETTRSSISAGIEGWNGSVEVVADATIEPGGCVLEVGACRIDAQISTAVARMRAALQ